MWNGYGKNCCHCDCWMHYPGNAGAIYASVGEKVMYKDISACRKRPVWCGSRQAVKYEREIAVKAENEE